MGEMSQQKWYRSPAKLMLALYLAASIGFLVPTVKSIIPINDSYQSVAGETAGGDFSVFYIGGKMAAQGNFSDLYHGDTFTSEREKKFADLDGGKLYFNYPPTALLLFAPFSTLDYMQAYSLWVILLLVGTALTIYSFTKSKILTLAALVNPAFLWCIITGQLGFLAAILMGTGLFALHKGKKLTAGMVWGLLIIKPHLALALPIAMIATREWRTIIGGTISSSMMIVLSLLIFGPEAWSPFYEQLLSNVAGHLSANAEIAQRIPTIFVSLSNLTVSGTLAAILHSVGALVAMAVTVLIWRKSDDTIARLLTLFITPALISPYYFDYDLTGLGLVFALMIAVALKNTGLKIDLVALVGVWLISFFMLIGKINIGFLGPVFLITLMGYAHYRAKDKAALPIENTAL